MGHTNSTTNYHLPQFLTTDKPAWLTDINNAFYDIDAAIHTAQSDATTAGNNATQALSDASAAGTAASAADAKGAGAVASLADTFDSTATYAVGDLVMYNSLLYICTVAVTTPGAWTGTTNWSRTTIEAQTPVDAAHLKFDGTQNTKQAIDANTTAIGTKQNKVMVATGSGTTSANGNITVSRTSKFVIIAAWCDISSTLVLPWIDSSSADAHGSTSWTLHFMTGTSSQSVVPSTATTYYYAYIEV